MAGASHRRLPQWLQETASGQDLVCSLSMGMALQACGHYFEGPACSETSIRSTEPVLGVVHVPVTWEDPPMLCWAEGAFVRDAEGTTQAIQAKDVLRLTNLA